MTEKVVPIDALSDGSLMSFQHSYPQLTSPHSVDLSVWSAESPGGAGRRSTADLAPSPATGPQGSVGILPQRSWRERLGLVRESLSEDEGDGDKEVDESVVPRPRTNRSWRLGICSCLSTQDGAGLGLCAYS